MIRVGILRGGTNEHYTASLETGGVVLTELDRSLYQPVDLFVDREGVLHARGLPISLSDIPKHVDVVFNALHGYEGEDGKIASLFRKINMPIVASSVLSSALFLNKKLSKEFFLSRGIKTPRFSVITREEFDSLNIDAFIRSITHAITPPWVLKPLSGTLGTDVFFAYDRFDLLDKLALLFQTEDAVLIEEKVSGHEVSVSVIESFRNKDHYMSIPIGCIQTNDGKTLCVARLHSHDIQAIEGIVRTIFNDHKGYNYGSVDIMMTRQGPVVLEVNDQPHFGSESSFTRSLNENGISWKEFLGHQIRLALDKK